jgi:Secretion system C-terminal sorting domain
MKSTLRLVVLVALSLFVSNTTALAQTFKISPHGKVTACVGDSITLEAISGFSKYSWNTGSSSRVIQVYKSGTYVCTATDSKGNSYSDSAVVIFSYPQRPQLSIHPSSASICSGDSIAIEANKGFAKYKWGSGSTSNYTVFYPSKSGTMTLKTIDTNGCYYTSYVQYSVKSCSGGSCRNIIDVWPDATLCGSADSVILEVAKGFSSYSWSDGTSGRAKLVRKAGWYYVTVKDSSGNTCTDSIEIKNGVNTLQVSVKPNPAAICKGDTALAFISGHYDSVSWSQGGTQSNYQNYSPTKTTTYKVYAIDSNGCVHLGEFTIKVKDSCNGCGELIYASKYSLCGQHDSIFVEVKKGFTRYLWSDKSDDRVRTLKSTGVYYVTVWDSAGNSCTDSIVVTKSTNDIKLYFNPNPPVICSGDKVVVEMSNDYDSIWWSNGGRGNRQVLSPSKTTTYVIEATDKHGCEYRTEFKVTVKDTCDECDDLIGASKENLCGERDSVLLEAKKGFTRYIWNNQHDGRVFTIKYKGWYRLSAMKSDSTWCYDSIYIGQGGKEIKIGANPRSATVCHGDSIELEASYGFKSYYWSVKGTKRSNGIKFLPKESMTVYVEAEDENGCESRAEIRITVEKCDSCPSIIDPWPSTSLCNHDSIGLEADNGYKSYRWSTGKEGRLLWVKKPGWYWLDYKDSSGKVCRDSIYISTGSTQELKVKVYPSRRICKGDTIVFSATEGFKSYGWNTGNKTRIFEYVAEKTKEIVVEAVDSNDCEARFVYNLVVDSCNYSGINELKYIPISFYPNPTRDFCLIKSLTSDIYSVVLYDIFGRLLDEVKNVNSSEYKLDLRGFNSGTIIVAVQAGDNTVHSTILKLD